MADATAAPNPLAAAIKDSLLAAFVAGVLAFPMLGFELRDAATGPELVYRFALVGIAMAAVFAGRLILRRSLFARLAPRPRTASAPRMAGKRWQRPRVVVGWALVGAAVVFPALPFVGQDLVDKATLVLIYVMLGWGLNIVVGLAGLLDLGYVAFYAIGAYTYALLSQDLGLSFWACLPLSGVSAGLFGVLLGFPVLRLRGDYLAIVTLGFGEIVRIILLNWSDVTGGPNGITDIARPGLFGLVFAAVGRDGQQTFADFFNIDFDPIQRVIFLYALILIMAMITNLFALRIRKLPIGRAWEALREDETASRSLGINPTTVKLSAFATGAMFAGFAGSFFAARQGFISPESFTFPELAIILAIVVLGGAGSQIGIVLAALLWVGLPEFIRQLELYRMLVFGLSMILLMLWRPRGLMSTREPTLRLDAT